MLVRRTIPILIKRTTGYDQYGQPIKAIVGSEKIAILHYIRQKVHTTVRADNSASRGHAFEYTGTFQFLASTKTAVMIDDIVLFDDAAYRVMEKEGRYDVVGKLDHYQVHCSHESDEVPS